MSSSSKNILWWCHVFTFIVVLMKPILSTDCLWQYKWKSNECFIFLNPVTNNFGQELCSNWYDRVSRWHDMMINTFQQQKQMWAMHFHNKHNLGQTHLNFWGQRCLYIKSFLSKTSRMFSSYITKNSMVSLNSVNQHQWHGD